MAKKVSITFAGKPSIMSEKQMVILVPLNLQDKLKPFAEEQRGTKFKITVTIEEIF